MLLKRIGSPFPLPPVPKEIFILCKQRPESTIMSSVASPKRVMPKDYHLLLALSFSFSGGSSVRAHRAHAPSRFLAP